MSKNSIPSASKVVINICSMNTTIDNRHAVNVAGISMVERGVVKDTINMQLSVEDLDALWDYIKDMFEASGCL